MNNTDYKYCIGAGAPLCSQCRRHRPYSQPNTPKQIDDCERVIAMLDKYGFRGEYFLYTMLTDNFEESFARVNHWRKRLVESRSDSSVSNINAYAQPFRNPYKRNIPPQWQKDIAKWVNQKPVFVAVEFKDYEPRKGFRCAQYFD